MKIKRMSEQSESLDRGNCKPPARVRLEVCLFAGLVGGMVGERGDCALDSHEAHWTQ